MKDNDEFKEIDFTLEQEPNDDNDILEEEREVLPCVPLRGVTIFPNTVVHFDIGREKSVKALEVAMAKDKILYVSAQKDSNILIPTEDDYFNMGTIVKVKQMLKIQGDAVRVLVEGVCRASIIENIKEEPYISVSVNRLENEKDIEYSKELIAISRVVADAFFEYAQLTPYVTEDLADKIISTDNLSALADRIAHEMNISLEKKQSILDAFDLLDRFTLLFEIISEENEIAEIEKNLSEKVKGSLTQNQKEYVLREKLKAIQEELGYTEDPNTEAEQWLKQLKKFKLDSKMEEKVKTEINKFTKMSPSSAEATVLRNFIETVMTMPWNKASKLNMDLKKAEKILNEDHYGLEKVKERILEYLAVIHLSKKIKGPIICLVGPPGVGKTSVAKSIARANGREFVRMSLGGVRDEAEIRGHRRTYIGAIPGRIISNIKEAGTNNPLFLLDEIDKIGADFKGDPASALLEVLDPEQNKDFKDHYLDMPFDLSKVMFITTANSLDTIPRPLLDRMEVINISGYTEDEKVKIAEKYLIPKKIAEHGLKKNNVSISEGAIRNIINYYTRESGVRNLEREIANICRKLARKSVTEKKERFNITQAGLENYLGKKRFRYDIIEDNNKVGVTTGLAWTSVGGDTLYIETALMPGTGKLQLTGKLGEVMQESAKLGISYIRANSEKYGIEEDFYTKYDVHIHVPEGAVPKDGPSAGVTICTAMISVLTDKAVKSHVAMTGELSLRGNVLPVGGIKEKVLAAHRAGIKTILVPKDNEADIHDIPLNVRKQLEFHLLDNVDDALELALVK